MSTHRRMTTKLADPPASDRSPWASSSSQRASSGSRKKKSDRLRNLDLDPVSQSAVPSTLLEGVPRARARLSAVFAFNFGDAILKVTTNTSTMAAAAVLPPVRPPPPMDIDIEEDDDQELDRVFAQVDEKR